MDLPPVVIDCGTRYTKLGYAGYSEPQFIIPSTGVVKGADPSALDNGGRWTNYLGM
ncbi:unnamed protein product [Meloidogyne enterolobii]|uniref:Uncharacterized protein n=1 Tax=Meloidogyne enterolobii TaxID=390850 RepID=A0ACB0ZHL6_MELEN